MLWLFGNAQLDLEGELLRVPFNVGLPLPPDVLHHHRCRKAMSRPYIRGAQVDRGAPGSKCFEIGIDRLQGYPYGKIRIEDGFGICEVEAHLIGTKRSACLADLIRTDKASIIKVLDAACEF